MGQRTAELFKPAGQVNGYRAMSLIPTINQSAIFVGIIIIIIIGCLNVCGIHLVTSRRDIIFDLELVFEPQLQGILSDRDVPVQLLPYRFFILGFPPVCPEKKVITFPQSLPLMP